MEFDDGKNELPLNDETEEGSPEALGVEAGIPGKRATLKDLAYSRLRHAGAEGEDRDLSLGHAALSSWHAGRTLLVVDNDRFDREYLLARLGRLFPDFDICEADGPFAAIEMLKSGLFTRLAKVFTDNQMSDMKGVELARVMRGERVHGMQLSDYKVEALKRVPVSLVTGDKDLSEASHLVDRGILDHVIRKPVSSLDISRGVELAVMRNMGLRVAL